MNYLMALLFTALVACSQPAEEIEYTEPRESKRSVYLSTIRTEYPELRSVPAVTLVTVAKSTCLLLDSGGTIDDLVNSSLESGIDPEMGGFMAGAAISTYCPQHKGLL